MNKLNSSKYTVIGGGLLIGSLIVSLVLFVSRIDQVDINNIRLMHQQRLTKQERNIAKFASDHLASIYASKPASEDLEEVKWTAHKYAVSLSESAPQELYESGRAVVLTATTESMPDLLIYIQWLRMREADIPIEVYLPDWSHYEPDLCADMLPGLDIECRVLTDIYGEYLLRNSDYKPSTKYLAMLASKYDDVVYYEPFSLPLSSPHSVLGADAFNNTGLVLLGTGEQARFEAGDIDVETCDPSQIFLSKSSHLSTLLLAAYYEMWSLSYNVPSAAAKILANDFRFAENKENAFVLDDKVIAWHPGALSFEPGRHFGKLVDIERLLNTDVDIEFILCDIARHLACDLGLHKHKIPRAWKSKDLNGMCESFKQKANSF